MNLEQLQREMAAAVMQPLTAEEQMQPHDTTGRWDGRPMDTVVSTFIRPNARLTSLERLEIYNRQYWFRLQTAFTEDFPVLYAVLGAERFQTLMNAYLMAHPSRSFTLRNLGSKLPDWLTQNPKHAGRRQALAIDVVRVEWACIEAFDNADLPPLASSDLSSINGESQLTLQPHLQLLALRYRTDELVLAMHQREKRESTEAGTRAADTVAEPMPSPRLRKQPTWLAVHRADLSLYYKRLTQPEFLALSALHSGLTLADALDAAFANSPLSPASRIRLVQKWFASWAGLGWLCKPIPDLISKVG